MTDIEDLRKNLAKVYNAYFAYPEKREKKVQKEIKTDMLAAEKKLIDALLKEAGYTL